MTPERGIRPASATCARPGEDVGPGSAPVCVSPLERDAAGFDPGDQGRTGDAEQHGCLAGCQHLVVGWCRDDVLFDTSARIMSISSAAAAEDGHIWCGVGVRGGSWVGHRTTIWRTTRGCCLRSPVSSGRCCILTSLRPARCWRCTAAPRPRFPRRRGPGEALPHRTVARTRSIEGPRLRPATLHRDAGCDRPASRCGLPRSAACFGAPEFGSNSGDGSWSAHYRGPPPTDARPGHGATFTHGCGRGARPGDPAKCYPT